MILNEPQTVDLIAWFRAARLTATDLQYESLRCVARADAARKSIDAIVPICPVWKGNERDVMPLWERILCYLLRLRVRYVYAIVGAVSRSWGAGLISCWIQLTTPGGPF